MQHTQNGEGLQQNSRQAIDLVKVQVNMGLVSNVGGWASVCQSASAQAVGNGKIEQQGRGGESGRCGFC
jgi:hypothetical protein